MPIIVRINELVRQRARRDEPPKERYTITELAKLTGLSQVTVRSWIKGRIERVDLDALDKWCVFLDCTPGDILVRVTKTRRKTE
jgi:DNA-binding Xre family transcriptional regulator